MATTRIDVQNYVNSILGTTDIIVDNNTIMAGMEDIVNRISLINPKALKALEVPVALTCSSSGASITLQYVPTNNEEINVYYTKSSIPKKLVRVDNPEHITNTYSLLNDGDYGKRYFWIRGNKLYVYPSDEGDTYEADIVKYGADNSGKPIWHDRYNYPLALYCSIFELNRVFNAYVSLLINRMIKENVKYDYTDVNKRLKADDVELAAAELQKIQTAISEQATASDNLRVIMENTVNTLQRIRNLRQEYYDWFGISISAGGE